MSCCGEESLNKTVVEISLVCYPLILQQRPHLSKRSAYKCVTPNAFCWLLHDLSGHKLDTPEILVLAAINKHSVQLIYI